MASLLISVLDAVAAGVQQRYGNDQGQSSRLLSDSVTETADPQSDINQLSSAVTANIVVLCVITVIWEISRPMFPRIYSPRRTERNVSNNRVPEAPRTYPFAWLVALSRVSENEVLQMAGLDAYMFLRYVRLCIRYCVLVTLGGVIFLVPIYGTAHGDTANPWTRWVGYIVSILVFVIAGRLFACYLSRSIYLSIY
jgi:hypothetical protein